MGGRASISADVLARYAGDAALEVEGVRGLVESHLPRHRPVRISVAEDQTVSVEVHLALEWGASFPEVGRVVQQRVGDRKSTRLNSSHYQPSRMPSSA